MNMSEKRNPYQVMRYLKEQERSRCAGLTGREAMLGRVLTGLWEHEYDYDDWRQVEEDWGEGLASGRYSVPSDFFRADYKRVLEAFVPTEYRRAFLHIIDRLNQFQFSSGMSRRTMRTRRYRPHLDTIPTLLLRYSELSYYGVGLDDLLRERLEEEKLDFLHRLIRGGISPLLIAAELDLGNGAVRETVQEAILSETNTVRVTTSMIRGILYSTDRELYGLLGKFLLAARLQEGVRQAICESMDCGTMEAFLTLFDVVLDNDLLRFSSVKRALATWSGLYNEKSLDRLTAKEARLIRDCLGDESRARTLLASRDPVEVHIGLWTLGATEAEDAMAALVELARKGERPQLLAASYYLAMVEDDALRTNTAAAVLAAYPDDLQLFACYLPSYLPQAEDIVFEVLPGRSGCDSREEELRPPKPISLTSSLPSPGEAEAHYRLLEGAYGATPPKGLCYDPCIFPWHQVKVTRLEVLERLCVLAWILQDQAKLESCAQALTGSGAGRFDHTKPSLMRLVFLSGDSPARRQALVSILKSGDASCSALAFRMLDKLNLHTEDYAALEGLLSSKRDTLRARTEQLLLQQGDPALAASVGRLLGAKNETERTAGLDLIRLVGEVPSRTELYAALCQTARKAVPAPTDKERVLLGELTTGGEGETRARQIANTPGFGIYDPAAQMEDRTYPYDLGTLQAVYACPEAELVRLLQALDGVVQANAQREYTKEDGQEALLGNGYLYDTPALERLPFPELWREFYENQVRSPELMRQLAVYANCVIDANCAEMTEWAKQTAVIQLFGSGLPVQSLPYRFEPVPLTYQSHVGVIVHVLNREYVREGIPFSAAVQAVSALADRTTPQNAFYLGKGYGPIRLPAYSHPLFRPFLWRLETWKGEEEFAQAFFSLRRLQNIYDGTRDHDAENSNMLLPESWYLKAWRTGLISKDAFYKTLFTRFQPDATLTAVTSQLARRVRLRRWEHCWSGGSLFQHLTRDLEPEAADQAIQAVSETIYQDLVPPMLSVELCRGDPPTVFSSHIASIRYVPGVDYLIQILTALGDQVLDRGRYYFWQEGDPGRQTVLSLLLSVSCPAPGETVQDLARALAGTAVSQQRLCDVAMRAPMWIDLLEEYLGWPGLKSGCYYFMAHMNEFMDEPTKAVVAKYTPLTAEELRDGAFDVDWFREAYGQLGPKRFQALYHSAKYISGGAKHARARKFADAALGKLDVDKTEAELSAKRNQDLLMAYGAIPLAGEADLLRRYQFLQQFAKQSRQFGAQRRASEGTAVKLSMKNLSVNAGYADVTRLTLRMENRLSSSLAPCLEWRNVGEFSLRIQVDEFGKSALVCRKGDKNIKSLPAKLSKEEPVKALKEVHKQLRDQYSRTWKMLEQAMEDRTAFAVEEVRALAESPVTRPMVDALVFCRGEDLGYLRAEGLTDPAQGVLPLSTGEKVVLAHPLDLYRSGCWSAYQADLFQRQIRQPFRQVFRELYLKLPEERDKDCSLLFAGNQIQPHKAKACLRERRWMADGQGLQKVYYQADIVAQLYALCDWFSPAEVEPPTLEGVVFSHRRTGQALKLSQVPDLIYSEVMRDVDLAVSVAHAGGVDPETSHSTVEMRRAIIAFNLPLFQLDNVELEGSHAIIRGALADYSIHLGSGIVHRLGGPMLNVLPVHSQGRGRLFLPFLDSDPKTAEILSKVVLFAQDRKIKDPFILNQIR